jgi:hypothetical protein
MSDTLDDNPGGATKFTLPYIEKVLGKFPFIGVSERDQILANLKDGKQVLMHLEGRPDKECFLMIVKVGDGLYGAKTMPHDIGQALLAANEILFSLEQPDEPEE